MTGEWAKVDSFMPSYRPPPKETRALLEKERTVSKRHKTQARQLKQALRRVEQCVYLDFMVRGEKR